MPWMGAAVTAGAGIVGDLMSSHGQSQTNAAMLQQQQQLEGWETQMSNTAMQRRVTDLKLAGLNPLLAIQQGGASTPGMSPVQLGNPQAAMQNLGSQVGGAVQQGLNASATAAQVRNLDAQTYETTVRAQNADPTFTYTDAQGARSSPGAVSYQKDVNTAQLIDRQRALAGQQADTAAFNLERVLPSTAKAAEMDANLKAQVLPYAVEAAKANAAIQRAGVAPAEAQSQMMSGPLGKYIPYLDEALKAVGVVGGVVGFSKLLGGHGVPPVTGAAPGPSNISPGTF